MKYRSTRYLTAKSVTGNPRFTNMHLIMNHIWGEKRRKERKQIKRRVRN